MVVGAQWGDEGKGKLVDVLAERADLVVRYQGGANAGHTVVIGETQFVLRQIPSGILHPRVACVVGNGVVLEPETFFGELDQLAERGIATDGRIFVSDRAHLVLPYHKLLDAASEKSQKLGTTGRGIGPAYEDKYGRRGIRVADLRRLECARSLLADRVDRANRLLEMMGSVGASLVRPARGRCSSGWPRGSCRWPPTPDSWSIGRCAAGKRVLLEGAQGALLDVDHGTYPFVTSSNTTAGGAAVGAGIGPTPIHGVLGVVKAYTTRVGNGPLPTEAPSAARRAAARARRRVRRGNRPPAALRLVRRDGGALCGAGERPHRARRDQARRARRVRGDPGRAPPTGWTASACDEMPAEVEALGRVEPGYEVLRGWNSPTGGARRLADLPGEARAYLGRLEELSGRAGAVRERGDAAGSDHRSTRNRVKQVGRSLLVDTTDILVIGAGPCGLAVGVAAKRAGLGCVLLDRRTIVSTIERYPLGDDVLFHPRAHRDRRRSVHLQP